MDVDVDSMDIVFLVFSELGGLANLE